MNIVISMSQALREPLRSTTAYLQAAKRSPRLRLRHREAAPILSVAHGVEHLVFLSHDPTVNTME